MSDQTPSKLFFDQFSDLHELYHEVKKLVILAEELYDEFPVTLTNEIRSSYDHIFRVFSNGDNIDVGIIEKEFISASRHLKRAGYDACELIVGSYIKEIHSILGAYDKASIFSVLGSEYSDIRLELTKISNDYLVEARAAKNSKLKIEDDEGIETAFNEFKSLIKKVDEWRTLIISKESFILEYQQEADAKEQGAEAKEQAREKANKRFAYKQLFYGTLISLLLLGPLFLYLELSGKGRRFIEYIGLENSDSKQVKSDRKIDEFKQEVLTRDTIRDTIKK